VTAPRKPRARPAAPAAKAPTTRKKPAAPKAARKTTAKPTSPPATTAAAVLDAATRPVEAAVKNEIAALAKRAKEIEGSALAALAVAMAKEIDKAKNSATAKSACGARLIDSLDRLLARVPPAQTKDELDEIRQRREKRLEAQAAAR
jgi:hypothetical protein